MSDTKKLSIGVYLDSDVINYLAQLEGVNRCSRSLLVNTIIRRHATAMANADANVNGSEGKGRQLDALRIINI